MNYESEYIKPILVEPGVKYFLNETLKQCRLFKEKYNNIIFNIVIFVIFIFILATILLAKYKGKLTPEQIEENEKQIIRFLAQRPEAKSVPLSLGLGTPFTHGLQILPGEHEADGFYYCLLRRID